MSTEVTPGSEEHTEQTPAVEKLVWTEPQLKYFKAGMAENTPGINTDATEAARS